MLEIIYQHMTGATLGRTNVYLNAAKLSTTAKHCVFEDNFSV